MSGEKPLTKTEERRMVKEAELLEATDNGPRPEDGLQPPHMGDGEYQAIPEDLQRAADAGVELPTW